MNTADIGVNRRRAFQLAPGDRVQWLGVDAVVTQVIARYGRVKLELLDSSAHVMHRTVDARTQVVVR